MSTTEPLDLAQVKALYTESDDCVDWHVSMTEGAVWVPELVAEIERERTARAAYADRVAALDQLLVCYRVGTNPSDALHRRLAKTTAAIAALSPEED